MTKRKTKHFVLDRLLALKTIKEKYIPDDKVREYKAKANMKEIVKSWNDDFRTQISAIVKLQKDADLKAAIPEYSFIPENEAWRKNRKIVREAFNYWWLKTNTDKVVSRVVKSATTYWTWIQFEWIKHVWKTIKTPSFDKDNQLIFKEDKVLIYSWIETRKVPFQNFWVNWDDIDNSTEAIEIRYFDMNAYIAEKKEDSLYKNLSKVKKTSKSHTFTGETAWNDVEPAQDDKNVVTEISYWNSATDQYIVLANDVEILNIPIPYEHKELPFCLYYDNLGEDRIYGIWEFELLEEDERYKNELRTLLVQWVKSSIWFILKDADNDLEEDDVFYWVGQIYEVWDIEGIKHFAPNVPVAAIAQAEQAVDTSIIQKTGVDINSLQTTPESATKTAGKSVSSKKRINDNIKDNAFDFFRRLAFLRMKNIQFLHKMKVREIPIKGWSIMNDWVFQKDESWAFGSAKIWRGMIEGDFMVVPIIETMTGDNKQRRKENAIRYSQVWGSIIGSDGQPVVKWEPLAELLTEEFGYDFDRMTQKQASTQSGKDIVSELKNERNGIDTSGSNPASPNFIPPEQRSGATKPVSTISGQAGTTPGDILAE